VNHPFKSNYRSFRNMHIWRERMHLWEWQTRTNLPQWDDKGGRLPYIWYDLCVLGSTVISWRMFTCVGVLEGSCICSSLAPEDGALLQLYGCRTRPPPWCSQDLMMIDHVVFFITLNPISACCNLSNDSSLLPIAHLRA